MIKTQANIRYISTRNITCTNGTQIRIYTNTRYKTAYTQIITHNNHHGE